MKKAKTNPGAPDWAVEPFKNFTIELNHLIRVINIAKSGIDLIINMKDVRRIIISAQYLNNPNTKRKIHKSLREEYLFAEQEKISGFSVLNTWAVLSLWALLEYTIRNVLAAWLKNDKAIWKTEKIKSLKLPIGEYEATPKNQRHFYVLQVLEHDSNVVMKTGINRFEVLLEPLGLTGNCPKSIRDHIYELCKVRNLIAHNSCKIDRRFAQACPWIKAKIGTHLNITNEMVDKYFRAANSYISIVICRTGKAFGADMKYVEEKIAKEAL